MTTTDTNLTVQPYLFFEGRCEEALEFYKKALGASVGPLTRFKESPEPPQPGMPPNSGEKIMHSQMTIGDTTVLVSDGMCGGRATFSGFFLTISVPSVADTDRYFNALAEGGTVHVPLAKTFFSPRFGMVIDRFGVGWMVIVPQPMPH